MLPLGRFAAHGFTVAEIDAGYRACCTEDGKDDGEDGADAEQRVKSEADQPHERRAEDQLVRAGTALYAFGYWSLGHGVVGWGLSAEILGGGVLCWSFCDGAVGAGVLFATVGGISIVMLNRHRA